MTSADSCAAKGCIWIENAKGPWCQVPPTVRAFREENPGKTYVPADCKKATKEACHARGCSWFKGYAGPYCHQPLPVRPRLLSLLCQAPHSHAAHTLHKHRASTQKGTHAHTRTHAHTHTRTCTHSHTNTHGTSNNRKNNVNDGDDHLVMCTALGGNVSSTKDRCFVSFSRCALQSEEATGEHGLGGMRNLVHGHPEDCGFGGISPEGCAIRGCVWSPQGDVSQPWCRYSAK